MTSRFHYLAPAGAPIHALDLVRATGALLSGADVHRRLRERIAARFGVRHSVLTSTGRAGMTMLLRALARLAPAGRDEVVLPSYTCYSLAASTIKAGLKPRLVDVAPETLDYRADALAHTDTSRVLAMVATNLYGLPNDLPALSTFARERGVFLIDDAAQSMGASIAGRPSGTWGDAGLFSFDKGKPISAIDGGVVVTNSDAIADALDREAAELGHPAAWHGVVDLAKVIAYAGLLRPRLYWVPRRIPQLGLGQTVFTTDFPLDAPPAPLVALAAPGLDHLEPYVRARVATARALLERLRALPGLRTIEPHAHASPTYLRAPVLVVDPKMRSGLIGALDRAGIGATGSYPRSLGDVPELRGAFAGPVSVDGGRYVADRVLTLPTHPFVTARDVQRIATVMGATLRGAALETVRG